MDTAARTFTSARLGRLFRLRLRGRLLLAILLVAVTTVAVGGVGIQRMGRLSDQAGQVYREGALPLDGLRQLQADWWELSAHTARVNITDLPATTIADEKQAAAGAATVLGEHTTAVARTPLSAAARASFDTFSAAVKESRGYAAGGPGGEQCRARTFFRYLSQDSRSASVSVGGGRDRNSHDSSTRPSLTRLSGGGGRDDARRSGRAR